MATNVRLYYGGDSGYHKNRRFMEALTVARWADLRRNSPYAYTTNIIVLGDFNLEKVGWDDPIWVMLGKRGLHLAPHSTAVGGSNIRDDRTYDQIAFFPGSIEDRTEASGGIVHQQQTEPFPADHHHPDGIVSQIPSQLADAPPCERLTQLVGTGLGRLDDELLIVSRDLAGTAPQGAS